MRLLIDQMFSSEIPKQLRENFKLDVESVVENPDLNGREDLEVFAAAQKDQRLVVTEDVGHFRTIALDWQRAGKDHFGLIFTTNHKFPRGRTATTGRLISALHRLASAEPDVTVPTNREIWL